MRREAATGGYYDSAWGHHPRLQILTIGELLEGKGVNMPPISQVKCPRGIVYRKPRNVRDLHLKQ